jgi:hypothetical protein
MSAGAEKQKVIAAIPLVSEGIGEVGDYVSDKGKVKTFRLSELNQSSIPPPEEGASPSERFAWSFRNKIEVATDVKVELHTGTVFRWLSDPDLEGYEIAQRAQMVSLVREALLGNRSVVIHGVVEVVPSAGQMSSQLTINRARAVEVVGVNI